MPHNNNIQICLCPQCNQENSDAPEHAPTVTPGILVSTYVVALRNLLEGSMDHLVGGTNCLLHKFPIQDVF